MATLEELWKFLNPFILNLRKMELELTCPSCSFVLRQPTLLPCTHIVCSQCISDNNQGLYECPVCQATSLAGDLRHLVPLEKMVKIFKSLDDAMIPIFQKLGPQVTKVPSMGSPLSGENSTEEKPQGTKFDDKEGLLLIKEKPVPLSPLTAEAQYSRKSNDAKSPIAVFSTETCDDVREVKRQKLNNEHESDFDSMLPGTSSHAYPEGSMKCAFCHLSKITEVTGPIVHYANGRPVGPEEPNPSKIKHFHLKCFEWAPQAYFEGVIAKNMESELARASKIKCNRCGRKGAALGCYVESCFRSYHLPCAIELPGCRWNLVGFHILCPSHSSYKFPCELKWGIKAKRSLRLHYKSKTRKMTKSSRCSAPIYNADLPEEQCDDIWIAEPGACDEWVLCGSDLSTSEMELLHKFGNLTGASVVGMWKQKVTHVIASTNENGACNRTRTLLMAILNGKWVLTIDWIKASMAARFPLAEEKYEIILDCYGISDGPKKGRIRANQKAPKIFTGVSFYFSDQFNPHYRRFLGEIVIVAGGAVLENADFAIEGSKEKAFSRGSSFIVYNEDPPPCESANLEEVIKKRCDEVEALVARTEFRVIGHMKLLDHIAACGSAADLENAGVQQQ